MARTSDDWVLPVVLLALAGGGGAKRPRKFSKGGTDVLVWAPLVQRHTRGTTVPTGVALAILEHESGGLATAEHHNPATKHHAASTDWGLMQLNDATLKDYGLTPRQALDPETNISVGVDLLQRLFREWGDWRYALAAYAVGSRNVKKTYPKIPSGTVAFVKYVLDKASGEFAGL